MKTIYYRMLIFACSFCIAVAFSIPCLAQEETVDDQSAATLMNDYRIGSGDVLEILVWKEDDLSREVMVRLDGKITVPLLDDIPAAGKTPLELKTEIQTRLEDFIEGPFVTVTLKGTGSQKFYVLGEVAGTGEYTLTKKLTALQAFALAGGFTEWAQKNEILVIRKIDDKDHMIRIDYRDIVRGKTPDDIIIQANDTIIVP
jgi:polysaccharide export outer membrane protein